MRGLFKWLQRGFLPRKESAVIQREPGQCIGPASDLPPFFRSSVLLDTSSDSIMERSRVLLVDGNNIIFAWPELALIQRREKAQAREKLIQLLEAYQDQTGVRVVVVFDGQGAGTTSYREADSIQIFYTSSHRTADDWIERLAIKYADQYDLLVATDDQAEQNMVVAAGAQAFSSTWLKEELDRAEEGVRDWIRRRRREL